MDFEQYSLIGRGRTKGTKIINLGPLAITNLSGLDGLMR